MQPFNIPKNPNISVQTRKQPPVHRYPAPFGGAPKGNPAPMGGIPQKERNLAFPDDHSQTNFDFPGTTNQKNPFEEGTPGVSEQGFFTSGNPSQHLEETPVVFSRGGNQEVHGNRHEEFFHEERNPHETQHVHQHNIAQKGNAFPPNVVGKKLISPNKKGIDDDEYVLMASANEDEEEQEEEPIVNRNRQNRPPVENQRIRFEEDRGFPATMVLRKNQNPSEGVDTNLMLKIKRLELELSKEKQRADFLESEQGKLIDDNAELRRRAEELNARVDLAKKYESNEKLANKEEEVQRLQIEITRLTEESRIYENHVQRISYENSEYRRESEALIRSLQEENQYLQGEIEHVKRDSENRNTSKIDMVQERNRILESQLAELKQQVQLLTDQLLMKSQAESEMQSIVSNLSRNPIQQVQSARLQSHSQINQTSPTLSALPRTTQETQTRKVVNESHHSQTSPPPHQSHQAFRETPVQFRNLREAASQEIVQHEPFEIVPEYATQVEPQQENLPQTTEFQQAEVPAPETHELLSHFQTEEHKVEEEQAPPKDERPPMFKPPVTNPHGRVPPPHHGPAGGEGMVSGNTLMNPPKYKIPQRHAPPKKPVGGFKPMPQLFGEEEKPATNINQEQSEVFNVALENRDVPIHHEQERNIKTEEELTHHQNPTTIQEPIHSIERSQPEEVHQQEDHPPRFVQPPVQEENKGESPPKMFGQSKPTIPGGQIVNRPPLFNVHHGKSKVKIGKNPFSEEAESNPPVIPEQTPIQKTFEQPPVQTFQQPPVQTFQPTNVRAQTHPVPTYTKPEVHNQVHQPNPYFQQEADQSTEAAENFFDQLGKGNTPVKQIFQPNQYTHQQEVHRPHHENVSSWNQGNQIQQSFGVENQIQQSFGIDTQAEVQQPPVGQTTAPVRAQIGKAVPVKKKKGALPTNMFD